MAHSDLFFLVRVTLAIICFKRFSFRNNLPLEMTLHLEWLRNNPKGPHGPIPQRAPKAPLGPFAPLGSLWFPWSLLAPCPWVPGPLGVGWGWGPRAKGSAPCRSDIRASRNCGGEAALPRRECTGSAGLRASVMDFICPKGPSGSTFWPKL